MATLATRVSLPGQLGLFDQMTDGGFFEYRGETLTVEQVVCDDQDGLTVRASWNPSIGGYAAARFFRSAERLAEAERREAARRTANLRWPNHGIT